MSDTVQVGPFAPDIERDRRDDAFNHLRGLLDSKTFGDLITAEEIIESSGFEDWGKLRSRILSYMRKRGFSLIAVPHNGYRVCGAKEQALRCRAANSRSWT